jgi:hypothetical protein
MKCLVFLLAIVALALAADMKKEEKKPEEKKPVEEKKPEEKKFEEPKGLVWPLPDPLSEGDLMLHGSICYDRVRALHKAKIEDDVDKMILAHGRSLLRRVSKFLDENGDFKIIPLICRDSRNLNSTTSRWRIEIPKEPVSRRASRDAKVVEKPDDKPKLAENVTDAPRNVTELPRNATEDKNETTTIVPVTQNLGNASTAAPAPSNATTAKPAADAPAVEKDTFETRRRDFYRLVGANFARLLLKEYRKEALITEEVDYLVRWVGDEAVHFASMAIYCNEGENIKEIKKQLAILLEESKQ